METRQISNQTNETAAAQVQAAAQNENAEAASAANSFMEMFQNFLSSAGAHAMSGGLTSFDQLPDISIEALEAEEAAMEELELETVAVEEEEVEVESEDEEVEEAEAEETTEEEVEQVVAEVTEEVVAELAARTHGPAAAPAHAAVEESVDETGFVIEKQASVIQEKKAEAGAAEVEAELTQHSAQDSTAAADVLKKTPLKAVEAAKDFEYDGRKIGVEEKSSELTFTINRAFDPARDAVGKPYIAQNENGSARQVQDPQAMIQNAVEAAMNKNGSQAGAENGARSNSALAMNIADTAKKSAEKVGAEQSELNMPKSLQDTIVEKIQKMLETARASRQGTQMVVRLDPPELGKVTIKLTQRADQMFARIIPESADVEAALRSRSVDIVNTLVSSGFKAENVNVSFGSEPVAHVPSQFEQMLDGGSPQGEQQSAENRFDTMPGNASPQGASAAAGDSANQEQTGWVA